MERFKTSAGKNRYRWDYQELRYLVYCLQQSKDFQETLNLFLDLHTRKEISEIIRRILIASLLTSGYTYEEITQATGAAPGTISGIQSRLLREKSVMGKVLSRAGDFPTFERRKHRDPIQRKIDRLLGSTILSGLLRDPKLR